MVTTDRTYQAYYTKFDPISDYMVGMLNLQPSDTVFEPCGGDGVFIDKILALNSGQRIMVYELNPKASSLLKDKYNQYGNVSVKEIDTLLDSTILTHRLKASKIIGSPPYGAVFSDGAKAQIEYRQSRKCRFQNSSFYFKQGIAVPMVRSGQLMAALINNRLFDQSIVGIFPHDKRWLFYLLGFFNSQACSYAINLINPSTNNSANYIKQLPVIKPSQEEFEEVTSIVGQLANGTNDAETQSAQNRLNVIFNKIYNFG